MIRKLQSNLKILFSLVLFTRTSLGYPFRNGGDAIDLTFLGRGGGGGGGVDVEVETIETSNFTFPLCQSGDGHEENQDSIPSRFLRMQNGNIEKARAAFHCTQQWRSENHIDTILNRPHIQFDLCKAILPHYFLGHDPKGHIVFCQRPGFANVNLMHEKNVSEYDLLMHYAYVLEFCWNILEPHPDQIMTSVLDLTGVSFSKAREMLAFTKQFVSMMSKHYPQRSYKTLIINAPGWFGALYRLISPLLRESTRLKIHILSSGEKQEQVLSKCLGPSLRKELLSGEPLDQAESMALEETLRNFVSKLI
jgi:CRAL/TRIO domain